MTSLIAAFMVFAWLVALLAMADVYRLLPKPGQWPASALVGPWPRLSVIIPARNEEKNIGPLLESVFLQEYPDLEVIVLNDHSTDRTAEIVAGFQAGRPGLRIVEGSPLPPGWAGKIHACRQAAALATGEWLLFLDADMRLEPECLKRSVAFARAEGSDLFTVIPKMEYDTFWEAVVQPIMALAIMIAFPAKALNDPESSVAAANGPFLLFRREAYEAIGGHAALEGVVVDDLALARRIKAHKKRLTYALGNDMARLRVFEGLRHLWDGWSRNIYVGLGNRAYLGIAAALGVFAFLIWPLVAIALNASHAIAGRPGAGAELALWAVVVLATLTCRRALSVLFGLASEWALLYPLGAVLVIGMILNSTWKGFRGQAIAWRGRGYSPRS